MLPVWALWELMAKSPVRRLPRETPATRVVDAPCTTDKASEALVNAAQSVATLAGVDVDRLGLHSACREGEDNFCVIALGGELSPAGLTGVVLFVEGYEKNVLWTGWHHGF